MITLWSKNWLDCSPFDIIQSPSRSPDINILGDVCEKMYEKSKCLRVRNIFRLNETLIDLFDEVMSDQVYIDSLFESIPARLNRIIQCKGNLPDGWKCNT